jgi:hypothetical protein
MSYSVEKFFALGAPVSELLVRSEGQVKIYVKECYFCRNPAQTFMENTKTIVYIDN